MAQTESTQKKICVACGKEYTGHVTACPEDGTTLTPLRPTDLVGTVLSDRYEIQELIGDGAMGQVYKAKHRLLKRTVAVKMMHPNLVSGAAALKRFQKEAELASALNHPNILTVYDFGVTDVGVPYLVMAYLQGTSLATAIGGGQSLDLKRGLHIFKQVSLGLAHAHEHGVVHRDIKPSNVMLVQLDSDPDFVKILDFGIAKLLTPSEGETSNLTRTGEVFGSPPYMSPEQCRAQPVDARSDVYSLGCVMYRTLSGKQPITGHDLIEYLYKHVNEIPPGFDVVCPEHHIPMELERTIFKAMAKQPDDRFQSMTELRAALDEIYQTVPGESLTRTDIPRLEIEPDTAAGDQDRTTVEKPEQHGISVSFGSQTQPPVPDGEDSTTIEPVKASTQHPGSDTQRSVAPGSTKSTSVNISVAPPAVTAVTGDTPAKPRASAPSNIAQSFKSPRGLAVGALALLAVVIACFGFSGMSGSSAAEKKIDEALIAARSDYNKGLYPQAKQKLRGAIKLAEQINSPKNGDSRYLLGLIQYAQGDYDDAQNNLETAKTIFEKHGNDESKIADCESYIGRAETAMGQYGPAEKDLQHSLSLRAKNTENKAAEADSLTGLAYLHMKQNKNAEAVKELKQALILTEKARGPDSQDTASALNDLGQAFQLNRNFKEAEPMYKRALAIRQNKLDGNSPFIADSYNCLGALCASTGRLDEAKRYYAQALAIQQKSLSASDPRLAQTRQQYADLVLKTGRR